MRSSVLSVLGVVACALAASCFDTPRETRVRITMIVPAGVIDDVYASTADAIIVHVHAHTSAADAAIDGSADQTEQTRLLYWDGTSPFQFDIELPAQAYTEFDIHAVGLPPGDGGLTETTLACASHAGQTLGVDSPTSFTVTLARSTPSMTCPGP